MKQKKLVLFDVDGTLIRGQNPKSGLRFGYAIKEVYGYDIEFDWDDHDGSVEKKIYTDELQKIGVLQELIDERLPQTFQVAHDFWVETIGDEYADGLIDAGADLVKALHNKVHLGLLTGNQESIGWKKVEMVGLRDYFEFGVFGHEADNRVEMAKLVPKKAKAHFGFSFKSKDVFVIGDTAQDIICGQAIKARTIGVTTGKFNQEDLKKHKPDLLVDTLVDKRVMELILKSS